MSGGVAVQAVLAADGGGLRALDSALYPMEWQAASPGPGRAGSEGVFDAPGGSGEGGSEYAESSAQCAGVHVWARVGPGPGRVRSGGAGAAARADARRAGAGGGAGVAGQ